MPDPAAPRPARGPHRASMTGDAPDRSSKKMFGKPKLVDLAEVRQIAHQDGDTKLANMNDRELRAAILENYVDQNATETVIRTRAIDAQNRAQ